MLDTYTLENLIQQVMESAHVPGLALAIVQGESIQMARGFGVTSVEDGGIPITPDTLFRIGSITKSMTACVIMKLVEQGLLDLHEPIQTYLPWLIFEATETPITLRMLLTHQSGLPSSHAAYGSRDLSGLERYIRGAVPHYPFIAAPGRVYAYSNPGFRLAGYIAEAVSGKPYPQLMQEILFDPLHMTRSTFDPTIAMTYPLAQSHLLTDDDRLVVQHRYPDNVAFYPSGGVITTVRDLAQYAIMHLHGGQLDGQSIIAPDLIALMHQPTVRQYKLYQAAYGFGFTVEQIHGQTRIGHEGLIASFGSKLVMLPDLKTAVIVLNNHTFGCWDGMDRIINHVLARLHDLPETFPAPRTTTPDLHQLSDRVGWYAGAERGIVEISIQSDQVVLRWNEADVPLRALSDQPDLYYGQKNGDPVLVGFVPGDDAYLMINGSPCRRTTPPTIIDLPDSTLQACTGTYSGADVLRVQVVDGALTIHFQEYDQTVRCVALSTDRFACDLGMIQFYQADGRQMVRQSGVYEMVREAGD